MEEVKNVVAEEQAVENLQSGQAEQAQEAPLSAGEVKTAKKNFKRSVLIMACGFVLGYMLGRMIFTELRMLAYVTGMAVSGLACAVYIKK